MKYHVNPSHDLKPLFDQAKRLLFSTALLPCCGINRNMTTSPEDTRAEAVDEAVDEARCCLICYEEESDENGDPVCNGLCACRGELGYFHLACLVEAAKTKTEAEKSLANIW